MSYSYHPVVELFPRLAEDEKKKLWADFDKNGVRVPIVVWDNQIIDGRHRYEYCTAKGEKYPIQVFNGSEEEAIDYAFSLNEARRHLTVSQRSLLSAGRIKLYEKAAENRMKAGTLVSKDTRVPDPVSKDTRGRSREFAAKDLGISQASVARGKKVIEEAEPEIVEAVRDGKIKISDAVKVVKEPKEVQRKAVRTVKEGKAKTLRQAVRQAKAKLVPSEDADPEHDPNGRIIPTEMIPCQNDGKALRDVSKQLTELLGLIKQIRHDPLRGARLRTGIEMDIENLKLALEDSAFYCVCVYCNGTGEYCNEVCTGCKEAGWITQHAYKNAPSEMRKKVPA